MTSMQLYPPLDEATEAALRASIIRFGVIVPVVYDQHGTLVDGHHRTRIAAELDIHCDGRVVEVADDGEARELARTLNEDRRMLSRAQRLPVVAALREEKHSLRAIAGALGVSKSTVEKDLAEVSTGGHLAIGRPKAYPDARDGIATLTVDPSRVTGLDGKSYPAKTARTILRENAHRRRLVDGLSQMAGICRGLADINYELATNACQPQELEDWDRIAANIIRSVRQLRSNLNREPHND